MKVSFPLSLKILLWLILNLVLLGLVVAGFFVAQGGVGWNSLVMGPTGNRLQSLGNIIAGEAAAAAESARDGVLARFGSAYHAEFFLVNGEGQKVAGDAVTLPEEVTQRIEMHPFGMGFLPHDPNWEKDRFLANGSLPPWPKAAGGVPPDRANPDGPGFRDRRELALGGGRGGGRFLVRTDHPSTYWIGLGVPFGTMRLLNGGGPGGGPPGRATLIVRTTSLWGVLRLLELQSWLVAAAGVLLLSALFWLPLMRGITRSLTQLTRATEQIAEGKFDTRVPAKRHDEIGRLGESVNLMAARLDTLVSGQKRFLGDVAHELCSPLARLQMATSILEERAPASVQSAVADVREEVQQMNSLVNELLAFTKAGLKPRDLALAEVEITSLINDTLARENVVDRVVTRMAPGLKVTADAERLSRALANLVRNALRYAGEAGPVTITVSRDGKSVFIAVEDEGPGVPAEALARLGEPFYRPESARSRETGGVGLGLSIVRSNIEACGGGVRFTNRMPKGFRAELRVPAA
jgi:two-component system sensor histidine kinase CpxA